MVTQMPLDQSESCRQWESAIRSGRLDEVDRLIEKGLNINCGACGIFDSPLDLAIFEGSGPIVQRVVGCGAILNPQADGRASFSHSSPLHLAAGLGRDHLVQLLLHAGALLDARDSDGDTPVWKAVRNDHRKTAIRLVRAGADIELRGMNGEALSDLAPWLVAESVRQDESWDARVWRGAQVSRERFLEILRKAPDVPPMPGDEIEP